MNLHQTMSIFAQTNNSWYGFDFDATLVEWHHGDDVESIGKPIKGEAWNQLKKFLKEGKTCKIVTARVGSTNSPDEQNKQRNMIQDFTKKHFGKKLEVTAEKDADMVELYDDKARQVKKNEGKLV